MILWLISVKEERGRMTGAVCSPVGQQRTPVYAKTDKSTYTYCSCSTNAARVVRNAASIVRERPGGFLWALSDSSCFDQLHVGNSQHPKTGAATDRNTAGNLARKNQGRCDNSTVLRPRNKAGR